MIIKKYPAPSIETAAERYDRDWLNIPDLDTDGSDDFRHDRTLLRQPVERKSRRYVDDGVSAVTGGSPVFDPTTPDNSTPVDPGDADDIVFFDDFSGTVLDSKWEVLEGEATVPPLKVKEGSDLIQIVAKSPLPDLDNEITLDVTPDMGDMFYTGFYTKNESGEFSDGLVAPSTVEGNMIEVNGGGFSYAGETPDSKAVSTLALRVQGNSATLFINGETAEGLSVTNDYEGQDLYPVIVLVGSGAINSVTVKKLGGGTPEPEEPEIPTEPEVPEGSYQENYTETY